MQDRIVRHAMFLVGLVDRGHEVQGTSCKSLAANEPRRKIKYRVGKILRPRGSSDPSKSAGRVGATTHTCSRVCASLPRPGALTSQRTATQLSRKIIACALVAPTAN
jgi:hypothetical protein